MAKRGSSSAHCSSLSGPMASSSGVMNDVAALYWANSARERSLSAAARGSAVPTVKGRVTYVCSLPTVKATWSSSSRKSAKTDRLSPSRPWYDLSCGKRAMTSAAACSHASSDGNTLATSHVCSTGTSFRSGSVAIVVAMQEPPRLAHLFRHGDVNAPAGEFRQKLVGIKQSRRLGRLHARQPRAPLGNPESADGQRDRRHGAHGRGHARLERDRPAAPLAADAHHRTGYGRAPRPQARQQRNHGHQ